MKVWCYEQTEDECFQSDIETQPGDAERDGQDFGGFGLSGPVCHF